MDRSMHLGVVPLGAGGYGQHRLWLDPATAVDASVNFDSYLNIARLSEKALLDFFFVADSQFVSPDSSPHSLNRLEPLTLLAALSAVTTKIGLVATASTSFNHPYNLARRLASIDIISNGRAGWNVVTTGDPGTATNFGLEEHHDHDVRYDMAHEFVAVMRGLWDTYEDDAFVRDRATSIFLDSRKQHALNHHGPHFKVAGPLNIQRGPQGHPVIFQAGDSEQGRHLGASIGDAIFTNPKSIEQARSFYADIMRRGMRLGRDSSQIKIFPKLEIVVAATDEEAQELWAFNRERDHPFEETLAEMQRWFGWHDFSQYDLDAPFPAEALQYGTKAYRSRAEGITSQAQEQKLSLRESIQTLRNHNNPRLVGSAQTVAHQMRDWWETRACDGFMIGADHPVNFARILDEVVPILQEWGIFRNQYKSETLRGHLGFSVPPNRHASARKKSNLPTDG